MVIRVTKDEIKEGAHGNGLACPIALAIVRRLRGPWRPRIIFGEVWWKHDSGFVAENTPLPRSARRFIDDFDGDEPVKPFAFRLALPPHVASGGLASGSDT